MATPRSAWGIDIGNRALKAIKLVRDPAGALRVEDYEVIEHETILSNAGDNRDALIQQSLANFVQRHPGRGRAAVSVSGSNSLARFIKLPPVETKKIPEIVRFEAIQQIPFPLEDVEWSYQLFQSPDSPDVEVGIFAMRKELINHHIKFFTDVGLSVEVVQLNPLAVYNAMYYDERLKGATMIIDLGSENTDLIIADGETIWLRSIPIGGKSFTDILVKQFKLPFNKAEELKRTAATSKYAKQIFQAMRPVFADMVAEVQRSIGFYASVHRDSRIKRVIALGGTFRLPGLQKYLQQNLQLEVDRVDRLGAGGPTEAKQRATFEENLLSLASAYGLAIQAMGDGKIISSLLPEHIRKEKLWRDKTPWFAAAAAGFVLGTGVAMTSYFLQKVQYDQNTTPRNISEATLRSGQVLDTKWKTQVEKEGAADRQRIANVRSMLQYRDLWPGLMTDLAEALPKPRDPLLLTDRWAEIKAKIPRKNRDVALIDSIASTYYPDLARAANGGAAADPTAPGSALALPRPTNVSGAAPAPVGATAPPVGAPGPPLGAPGMPLGAPGMPLGAPGMPLGAPGMPLGAPGARSAAPAAESTDLVPAGSRGFVVVIKLTTPYGGKLSDAIAFIQDTFVKNLRARGASDAAKAKGYSIPYVEVTRRRPAGEDETYKAAMRSRDESWAKVVQTYLQPPDATPVTPNAPGAPGGGPPGAFPGAPQSNGIFPGAAPPGAFIGALPPAAFGATGVLNGALIDPLTGEEIANDTNFEVTALVVIIDPDAATATAGAGALSAPRKR